MGKAPMAEEEGDVVKALFNVIEFVGSLPNYQWMQRKECFNLVRRIKQLVPMLEEVREFETGPLPAEAEAFLGNLKKVFVLAKKLLRCCHDGSKIYLVRISSFFLIFLHFCLHLLVLVGKSNYMIEPISFAHLVGPLCDDIFHQVDPYGTLQLENRSDQMGITNCL